MKKTKALIVWNLCPEEIHLYVIDYEEWMDEAHGTYININANEATSKISILIEGKEAVYNESSDDQGSVIEFNGKVIVTGFVL